MTKFANRFAAFTGLSIAGMSAAHAELPAALGTAVGTATTDIGSAGGLILGVVVAIAAVAWLRRVVK